MRTLIFANIWHYYVCNVVSNVKILSTYVGYKRTVLAIISYLHYGIDTIQYPCYVEIVIKN